MLVPSIYNHVVIARPWPPSNGFSHFHSSFILKGISIAFIPDKYLIQTLKFLLRYNTQQCTLLSNYVFEHNTLGLSCTFQMGTSLIYIGPHNLTSLTKCIVSQRWKVENTSLASTKWPLCPVVDHSILTHPQPLHKVH